MPSALSSPRLARRLLRLLTLLGVLGAAPRPLLASTSGDDADLELSLTQDLHTDAGAVDLMTTIYKVLLEEGVHEQLIIDAIEQFGGTVDAYGTNGSEDPIPLEALPLPMIDIVVLGELAHVEWTVVDDAGGLRTFGLFVDTGADAAAWSQDGALWIPDAAAELALRSLDLHPLAHELAAHAAIQAAEQQEVTNPAVYARIAALHQAAL